jgi:tryptophan-rich sensory protein
LLAGSGYRLLRAAPSTARITALSGWGLTLLGLAGYPWLFFRKRRLGMSALVAGAMMASAATTALAARKVDGPAAALTTPLIAWLAFATLLSAELLRRNTRR